jgi:Ca2+-binding RTX toxin-like protein
MGGKSLDGATFADEAANPAPAQSGGRLPTEQAQYFFDPANRYGATVWNILSYYGGDIPAPDSASEDKSGFAATLFERNGEKALALRGTEPDKDGGVDLDSADTQIGLFGLALTQVVSMANYITRLRAPVGVGVPQLAVRATLQQPSATVRYITARGETAQVAADGTVTIADTPVYLTFVDTTSSTGLGKILDGERVTLTGHSLGGHLAYIAARLFPDVFDPTVVVFNSAGYDPTTENLHDFLNSFPLGETLGTTVPLLEIAKEVGDAAKQLSIVGNQLTQQALDRINAGLGRAISQGTPNVVSLRSEDLAAGSDRDIIASELTGADKYGTPIDLPTENNNHVIEPFMDALALQAAIEPIRGTSFGTVELERVLRASSNTNERSYEEFTEALFRLFLKDGALLGENGQAAEHLPTSSEFLPLFIAKGSIGARNAFHDAVLKLQPAISAAPQPASLSNIADMQRAEFKSRVEASNAFAYRYALMALNPFAVLGSDLLYAQHNAVGDLNRYTPAVTPRGGMTDQYIADRVPMWVYANTVRTNDVTFLTDSSIAESTLYEDRGTNLKFSVLRPGEDANQARRVAFGADGTDSLTGTVRADQLYGAAGTDALEGKGGNDYLEGGRGLDLYLYGSQKLFGVNYNEGGDTILDVDGKGVLRYTFLEGTVAFGTRTSTIIADASVKLGGATWQSADGRFRYEWQGSDLRITLPASEAGGTIMLKDFRDGDFGIRLFDPRTAPFFAATENVVPGGNDEANTLTGGATADLIRAFGGNDTANGGGGDDIVEGGAGNDVLDGQANNDRVYGEAGDDRVTGGLGDDEVYGGLGRDFVSDAGGANLFEGGADGDVLYAFGPGRDELYGDATVTLASAITGGEGTGTGLRGEWIMAGADEDVVAGGADNDALLGGGGGDIIVGGAGNDDIAGDLGWVTNTLDWNVTRVSNEQGNSLDFGPAVTLDSSAGGGDTIYAGGGADWVLAGEGDDFVDAGTGDDVVTAGAGADIVLGGAGNDLLHGDSGNTASAGDGGDYLDGGAGVDLLFGNAGEDILVGGAGDDYLEGGAGRDIYVYARGDGVDTLNDTPQSASDPEASIIVTSGIARGDVKFRPGSLLVDFGGGDAIRLEGFDQLNPASIPLIGQLQFDDGEVMTYADILAQGFDIDGTPAADLLAGTGVTDRIRGLEGNDVLLGFDGNDALYGGSGSDTLQGGNGDDYLEGGEGFDSLNGGAGEDSYAYDTLDVVTDTQGNSRVVFGAGITPESLNVASFTVSGQARLLIERPGTAGAGLELRGVSLTSTAFTYAFADGRTLSQTELLQAAYRAPQTLTGGAGNDTLTGFAGNDNINGIGGDDAISGGAGNDLLMGGEQNDSLLGGAGNDSLSGGGGDDTLAGGVGTDSMSGGTGVDTYLYGHGEGNDTVSEAGGADQVRLADGIARADITLARQANGDLTLTLNATQERLTINGWYGAAAARVEQIVFGDGTVVGESELAALAPPAIAGTAGNDVLRGTAYEDTLEGLAGDDTLDGGPSTFLPGDAQSSDLLLGGEGHDTYVLGWRSARDTVIETAGETSTIRLAPGMSFSDVTTRREGDDLFVHGYRTEHGLVLKNYYTQAHDWRIGTASGSPIALADFMALPVPGTGDPAMDLWEAQKTAFKHDWYGLSSAQLQPDAALYQPPGGTVNLQFTRSYNNGDWAAGSGGPGEPPLGGASQGSTRFAASTVITSDAASQFHNASNTSSTSVQQAATFDVGWNPAAVSRSTQFLGTFVGFDLLLHSLYSTNASVSLTGSVNGITPNAANGASGADLVAAVMANAPLPGLVNGSLFTSTSTFSPVEVRGGASNNVIELRSFGMIDGGAGNDIIDAVGGGAFNSAAGGNFLYGGAGNDGITGSGRSDVLSGGPGNDTLAGWSDDDTFYFSAADAGVDVVNEVTWYLWDTLNGVSGTGLYNADSGFGSTDTVEFGPGLGLADLTLSFGSHTSRYWTTPALLKAFDTLDLSWGGGNGVRVMMPDRLDADVRRNLISSPGSSWGVERFKFADGTVLSLQQMLDRMPAQVLNGTAGNDVLQGGAGNNVFSGGGGADEMNGAFGSDVYHFGPGSGVDRIRDPGGNDKVVFGAGITPEMLTLGVGSLLIRAGGGDELHIEYFDPIDPFGTGMIETYEFADGSVLTHAGLLARGFDLTGGEFNDTLTGTSLVDRMRGFGGNDTLNGAAGADVLEGGAGNDTLNGGAGADSMAGGAGDDSYVVDDAADAIAEHADDGVDLVQAGINFVLADNLENLTLTGSAASGTGNGLDNVITGNGVNNVLSGLGGNDTLVGAGANDMLDGGTGADSMNGGDGNDTYLVDHAGDTVTDSLGTADLVLSSISFTLPNGVEQLTLTGTADINGTGSVLTNVLTGNSGNNVLSGGGGFREDSFFGMAGNDTLLAGDFADFLDGGAGADFMQGGAGNDTYVVDDAGDVVVDTSGFDMVQTSVDYALAANLENLTLIGTAAITGTANELNNQLTGNNAAGVLAGGVGNDTYVIVHSGTLIVENSDEGTDHAQTSVSYAIADNVEQLTLTGSGNIDGAGNALDNLITGNSGVNALYGRDGNDTLNGGAEADVMAGGRGNDTYIADNLFDAVVELANEGTDLVQSSVNHTLAANVENLTLTGSASIGTGNALANVITGNASANTLSGLGGDDTLIGSGSNDTLNGGDGADTLDGGTGNDTMNGGEGNDTYVVNATGDIVNEAANAGSDTVQAGVTYTLGANQENLTLTGTSLLNGTGNELANTIAGNGAANLLDGGAGDDVLMGGEGGDSYRFDLGTGLEEIQETDADGNDIDGVLLGSGISTGNVLVTRSGSNLALFASGSQDRLTVRDWFAAAGNRIERTVFADGTVWDAATLESMAGPSNSAPVLASPVADQAASEDVPFSFGVPAGTFSDPDAGDTLSYSAARADGGVLPGWLTFDVLARAFSGTPLQADVGLVDLRVTATDPGGLSAEDVFTLSVSNTNDAPTVASAIADQAANEDQAFQFSIPAGTFLDVDAGDTLTLTASLADGSVLPAWLSFDGASLAGTPGMGASYEIRITATDSAGANAADVFRLDVANVNDAPVVANAITDRSFEANALFSFAVRAGTFFDEDGDTLTYSASLFGGGALPSWLAFDAAAATFSGTPLTENIGISHIAVTAMDASGAAAASDFGLVVRASAGSTVSGGSGDDVIYGGSGDETLSGQGGNDAIFGDVGDDLIRGGTGNDVLQGQAGDDVIRGGNDSNVLDGGSGNDLIFDGSGSSFVSGGAGDDVIRLASGRDVISFNDGDGWDTIIGGGDGGNTLSFGGGIRYSDLSFSRAGNDLVVSAGENQGIVLNDWYAGSQSVLNLQIILDATDEFDAGSSDPLFNRRVQTFSFAGLVSAFDQAREASPGLTSWDITNALLQWHLWAADDLALGGDLAYWYGRNRTLAGISLVAAQQVIGAPDFGAEAQSLRPFSGLQEGLVKLG